MKIILNSFGTDKYKSTAHPWILEKSIAKIEGEVKHGALAPVLSQKKEELGYGFYSAFSKIKIRMLGCCGKNLTADWLKVSIKKALNLRAKLSIQSNAYRLINADGDGLPGLIIDCYNKTLVVRPEIKAWEILIQELVATLVNFFPEKKIYLKRDERAARIEKIELDSGYLHGKGDGFETIEENGLVYKLNIKEGQKTGFYLDQRENRKLLEEYCKGLKVLDLFCYTGGFSLSALKGGAVQVDSLDSSVSALSLAKENYLVNFAQSQAKVSWFKEDCFSFLEKQNSVYDLVILDPPPFARTKGELIGARRGYLWLHEKVLQLLAPQGFLLTFSCSQAVSKEYFANLIRKAANKTGRRLYLLKFLQAACDHIQALNHPEGDYLKGFLFYVT